MATVIPPGFGLVALRHTLAGDNEAMFVTFGVEFLTTPGAQAHAINICDAWQVAGGPLDSMSNLYTFTGAVLSVGQDGGPPVIVEEPRSAPGRDTSSPLPQNCALLVRKRTNLAGREGRGRMYVPGFSEGNTTATGGIPSANLTATQTRYNTFFSNLSEPPDAGAVNMVILHTWPQLGALPAPTPVTSLVVDAVVATQRRRLRR